MNVAGEGIRVCMLWGKQTIQHMQINVTVAISPATLSGLHECQSLYGDSMVTLNDQLSHNHYTLVYIICEQVEIVGDAGHFVFLEQVSE